MLPLFPLPVFSSCVVWVGCELTILLCQLPECWGADVCHQAWLVPGFCFILVLLCF